MSNVIAIVLCALLQVESSNSRNIHGYNDGGSAVGVLQIHRVAVREANRIVGYQRWTYADRHDAEESKEMCRVTMAWHYRRGVKDPVELACRWNRPDGTASRMYRGKVKRALQRLTNERKVQ